MTTPIPQIEDLYYVCLDALQTFDQPVHYSEMDSRVISMIGQPDDSVVERRLKERVGFARSALKRIGAADNAQRGHWAITDVGREYLTLGPEDGLRQLSTDVNTSYSDRTVDPGFLEEARRQALEGAPLALTVRDLLGKWKVARRGSVVNQLIRESLEAYDIETDPDFTTTWIDGLVHLVSLESESSDEDDELPADSNDDITLTVGSIEAANRNVASVLLNGSLIEAQTMMMRFDYSQLAVLNGPRSVRGAITWESIAQERLRNSQANRVADAVIDSPVVKPTDHLLEVVEAIIDHGFVLVQGVDGSLSGIVTMADLSVQFANLANPFVLLSEIERWLRKAVDGAFNATEIQESVGQTDRGRAVESAADLTLGEILRVIERPANWDRIGWEIDRSQFIEALDEVRRIRNDAMHFSPDPLSPEDLDALRRFLHWVRFLMEPR